MASFDHLCFHGERALFRTFDARILNCHFIDGESPLKESGNLTIVNSTFSYKYPLWYGKSIKVDSCTFEENARAAIWYTQDAEFSSLRFDAPKSFRHCKAISLSNIFFSNPLETLWWNDGVKLTNIKVIGSGYFGMGCKNVVAENILLESDYAFDGAENVTIKNSKLLTKDAFWNAKHIRLENCIVEGEYFGWNSLDVTLLNCKISSLQGFCYMKNLKLVNCDLGSTNLCFEYCEGIDADISSRVVSIKNPISGRISCLGYDELIRDDERLDQAKTEIVIHG